MAFIAAGTLKRKQLLVPKGDVRPTQRTLRLSVFDFLADFVKDASVLDLFAGTGAFGIEALSRGARKVVFVDIASKAVETITQNLFDFGIRDNAVVYQGDSLKFLVKSIRKNRKFDIIFLDPPFTKLRAMKQEQYESYMMELIDRSRQLLGEKSIIIVKYPRKLTLVFPETLALAEQRDYSLNRVAFLVQKEYVLEQ